MVDEEGSESLHAPGGGPKQRHLPQVKSFSVSDVFGLGGLMV
jgi:hypothetical protein